VAFLRRTAAPNRPRPKFRISQPQPKALTASAVSVGVQDGREAALKNQAPVAQSRSKIEQALGFYATDGVCWYPSQFYSRAMKRIRYYPAILNDAGEPEEVEDGPLRDLFDRIHDPGGTSMAQLASNYGRLRFLIGDGYLIVSEQEGEEVWEYLSPLELALVRNTSPQEYKRDDGIEKRTLIEAGDLEKVGGDRVRVWRLWCSAPGKSGQSDSPVLAQIENYALLDRLRLAAGATSWSRAMQRGMAYIPDEVDLAGHDDDPNDPGVDEDPMEDSSIRELVEALTSPIRDPGSVEGAAPVIMRGPAVFETPNGQAIPFAQLIASIPLGTGEPYYELDAIPKVIDQISLGLDMPAEMLTGTAKVNHWGGWLLDEQAFRQHVAPVVEDFCEDIGSAYLRPAAKAEALDWENVVVWYDPVAAIAHPDEGPTASTAWGVGAVSREFYRNAIGATDEDAPTPEDEAFLLELLGRRPAADQQTGETAPQDGGTGGDTTEAPPAEPTDAEQNGNAVVASANQLRQAMVMAAGESFIRVARKQAGARLVQRSKSCGECQDAIRDIPLGLVASTLGTVKVREIINGHTTEEKLVCGVGDLLAEQVREFGISGDVPAQLGAMVESHALRTLYKRESPSLPPGFAAVVEKALH
jgi:hypothetical protein